MMRFKNMLKCFSKTEVREDKTHPTPPLEREGALGALNNAELYPLPLEQASRGCKAKPYPFIASAVIGEREELLCERSELSNSGEGCKDLPSPDATRHPLPGEGRFVIQNKETHPNPPLESEGVNVACAKHTEKDLSSYLPIHLFTFKKVAFTLAEVLITLGIIGVVAAITLPALIHKYQMKSFEVAFKKEYSVIQNAIDYLTLENSLSECALGVGYTSVTEDCEALYNGLISQLKLSKINKSFSYAWSADVFANGGEAINPHVSYDTVLYYGDTYTLLDGASILFLCPFFLDAFEVYIVLDVNGLKGPNKWGYDAFFMTLVKHNNKLLLTDEYASIIEKGGKYPRTILRNQDNNSPTNGWKW